MTDLSQGSLELLALFSLLGLLGTYTIVMPLLSFVYSLMRGILIWRSAGKQATFDEKVDYLEKHL